MTPRQRAHRAFFNAAACEAKNVPLCWGKEEIFGSHADAPACGILCDRVTDAIEIAQAETGHDSVEALREILARKEKERRKHG